MSNGGGGKKRTTAKHILIAERDAKAMRLRKAGHEYATIVRECGFNSIQAAHLAIRRRLDELPKQAAEELRTVMQERLEEMFLSIYEEVKDGNHGAIDRALRILERQARLDGLDREPTSSDEVSRAIVILADKVSSKEDWVALVKQQRESKPEAEPLDI